jgi:hypothetical protein
MRAVRYVCERDLTGDYVECGVWRGGSSMAAAWTYQVCGRQPQFWLYDTYQGMPEPVEADRKIRGIDARSEWVACRDGDYSDWCRASLEDVKANMALTGYPGIRYVVGKCENTLLTDRPDRIALLRLDTDFYESTKAELEILWDRVVPGGVVILDDYGSWGGAKLAVDEFFASRPSPLLNRLDHTGRLLLKV